VLTKGKFKEGSLEQTHFVAEGEISFKSLLYIPKKAPSGAYSDIFNIKKSGVQLYVRRVLISDEFEDFLPRYMNFVRGVVDSDDLPLNVSRETLAESRVLKVMSKKLVRKILDALRKLSEAGEATPEEDAEGEEVAEGEEEAEAKKDDRYEQFWNEYGRSIKFGVIDDRKNLSKLSKLLRYQTSKSEDKFVSLQSYVDRMAEGQKYVYYIVGESLEKVKNSPFLEKVEAKGYEVVYMTETIDEYVVGALTDYEGHELQSVTKENLKLGDEERKSLKELKKEYKPLTAWFKEVFGKQVEKVEVSNRLGKTPCVLVTGQYGWSANMQRIVQGATLSSTSGPNSHMLAKKTFEVNVQHPIMQAIHKKVEAEEDDESTKDLARMLLDSAMLQSGFQIEDLADFKERMKRVVGAGLGVDPDAPIEEDVDVETEEEEEADEEEVEEATDDKEKPKEEL